MDQRRNFFIGKSFSYFLILPLKHLLTNSTKSQSYRIREAFQKDCWRISICFFSKSGFHKVLSITYLKKIPLVIHSHKTITEREFFFFGFPLRVFWFSFRLLWLRIILRAGSLEVNIEFKNKVINYLPLFRSKETFYNI